MERNFATVYCEAGSAIVARVINCLLCIKLVRISWEIPPQVLPRQHFISLIGLTYLFIFSRSVLFD